MERLDWSVCADMRARLQGNCDALEAALHGCLLASPVFPFASAAVLSRIVLAMDGLVQQGPSDAVPLLARCALAALGLLRCEDMPLTPERPSAPSADPALMQDCPEYRLCVWTLSRADGEAPEERLRSLFSWLDRTLDSVLASTEPTRRDAILALQIAHCIELRQPQGRFEEARLVALVRAHEVCLAAGLVGVLPPLSSAIADLAPTSNAPSHPATAAWLARDCSLDVGPKCQVLAQALQPMAGQSSRDSARAAWTLLLPLLHRADFGSAHRTLLSAMDNTPCGTHP